MNRSVRSLLGASVLVPAAALAVAAAPAHAAPPGPSTTLLYETYAAAAPAGRALPENVTMAAGQTAEMATLTVDGAIESAPARTGSRTARCSLDPSRTIGDGAGADLPGIPPTTGGKNPVSALAEDACLGAGRLADHRAERDVRPLPLGGGGIGGGLLGGGLPGGAQGPGGDLSLPGAGVLTGARRADSPLSMDLAHLPATLAGASPAGLPLGRILFPPAARISRPGPAGDVVGQAGGPVGEAGTGLEDAVIGGAGLDAREEGVGKVVKVLKARERAAKPGDGPVSLLDSPGLGSPGLGSPGLDSAGLDPADFELPEVPALG